MGTSFRRIVILLGLIITYKTEALFYLNLKLYSKVSVIYFRIPITLKFEQKINGEAKYP